VSGPLVRRLRLPPAATSPALARNAVTTLLRDAGLTELCDEAVLLTSELVTNGVIHARTEIELEIVADADGVGVTVTDFASPDPALVAIERMPAGATADAGDGDGDGAAAYAQLDEAEPADGGRGLLLVSRFASRWGTSHEPGGRAVWFRLDHRPPDGAHAADRAGFATEVDAPIDIDSILAAVVGRAGNGESPHRGRSVTLSELLARMAKGLGAATATVSVDRADGAGSQVFARYASAEPAARGGRTVRIPLSLSRPWTGELTATGASGRHAETIAALTGGQLALLVENQRLQEAHHDRRGWLLFLAEAGELLAQSMNVGLTVALIPHLVVPRLGLWCAVHMTNEFGELTLTSLTHADESAVSALADQLGGRMAVLRRVLAGDGFAPLGAPTDGMSCPLAVRGEHLGTLSVGRPDGRTHSADELAIIEDLGRRAAIAIDNARVHDNSSRIATALQRSLLPPALPRIEGLEVAAQYVPAGNGLDVGGDFYDVVPLPRQGWMLVLGDVSGKGVGAAAVTGLVRDVLHTLALDHREPEHTLSRLNATLVERGGGYFCTLALAFLTAVKPGVFDLSLHLAGHDQPVLLRADGTTSLVGRCGTALGLMDDVSAPRMTLRLSTGDALVFYTDGVTERRRGRILFGHRRLRTEISSQVGAPAAVLAAHLRSSVLAFSPVQPRDDIAIVAVRAQ